MTMLKSTISILLMTDVVIAQDAKLHKPAIQSREDSIAKTITKEYQAHRLLSPRRKFGDESNEDENQRIRKGLRDRERNKTKNNANVTASRVVSKREERKSRNENADQSNKPSRREKNKSSNEAIKTNGEHADKPIGRNKRNNKETIAENLAKSRIVARSLDNGSSKNTVNSQPKNALSQRGSNNRFPVKYPKIRFMQWEDLSADTRAILGTTLGYERPTWEKLGSHDIEKKIFEDFDLEEQVGLMMLGLGGYVWDCFVNRKFECSVLPFCDELPLTSYTPSFCHHLNDKITNPMIGKNKSELVFLIILILLESRCQKNGRI